MWFDRLSAGYRRLAYPVARLYLRRALASDLPTWLDEPLSFLLSGRLWTADQPVIDQVEAIRTLTASRPDVYGFEYIPAGSGQQDFIRIVTAKPAEGPISAPVL